MTNHRIVVTTATLCFALSACTPNTQKQDDTPTPANAQGAEVRLPKDAVKTHKTFDTYWYQGLAELSHYKLEQSRYGQIRKGEAVMVYVTEDFLKDKQVKYEFGDKSNAVSVLKLNAYRSFNTGIYPYTIMTSSFVPIKANKPMKLTSSVTEWCGQAFMQLNHRNNKYELQIRSYFQAEGDQNQTMDATVSEDGLFNQVRHNPKTLPVGQLSIIPAFHTLRLKHKQAQAYKAKASMKTLQSSAFSKKPHLLYAIDYEDFSRHVYMYIEAEFPHRILAWQESSSTPLQEGKKTTGADVTTATWNKSILLDYWSKNGKDDNKWQKILRTP